MHTILSAKSQPYNECIVLLAILDIHKKEVGSQEKSVSITFDKNKAREGLLLSFSILAFFLDILTLKK